MGPSHQGPAEGEGGEETTEQGGGLRCSGGVDSAVERGQRCSDFAVDAGAAEEIRSWVDGRAVIEVAQPVPAAIFACSGVSS